MYVNAVWLDSCCMEFWTSSWTHITQVACFACVACAAQIARVTIATSIARVPRKPEAPREPQIRRPRACDIRDATKRGFYYVMSCDVI